MTHDHDPRFHHRMKRLVFGLAVLVMVVLPTMPAHAGGSAIDVSGELGPGGTAHIEGNDCAGFGPGDVLEAGTWQVIFYRQVGENMWQVAGPGGSGTADLDGLWSFDLPIPANAITGDTYQIHAGCTRQSSGEPVSFNYDDFDFVMGEAVTQPTDTTDTTAPDPTTGDTSSVAPAAAASAAAAAASPRFTG
jgi:hypothetical protein